MYTGDWLEPEEAYRLGMLNRLVPPEELVEETLAIARKIASGPPASLRLMKLQTYRSLEITLDAALELAADGEALMLATNDHVEALSAWFEKREPKFTGK
jgi:enoyl-CoA hydratase/carnithine racemase